MQQKMLLSENLVANMTRMRQMLEQIPLVGKWRSEHWRSGKLLDVYDTHNDITTPAKNSLFDTMFNAATQIGASSWVAGLIDNSGFTGYNASDTMSSHTGWTEWTSYTQTTRVAWGQGAASAAAITNASPITFDINGTGTIRGLFITTVATKGGTTGLLWSAASYSSTVAVVPGDQIRSTYSLSC
jgi:hypothetical protein